MLDLVDLLDLADLSDLVDLLDLVDKLYFNKLMTYSHGLLLEMMSHLKRHTNQIKVK